MPRMSIASAIRKHEQRLLALPNVTGVGIGHKAGKEVITVLVTHKVPESDLRKGEIVPTALEGYEIVVDESGVLTLQAH